MGFYEELKKNMETIKEISRLYQREITDLQVYVIENIKDKESGEDYRKFLDELSIEDFSGLLYDGLANGLAENYYEKVLTGEMTIEELCKNSKEMLGL